MPRNFGTILAYRTATGGEVIPANLRMDLTDNFPLGLPVHDYPTIRVYAASRASNNEKITVTLTNAIPMRRGLESTITLDTFTLAPGETFTKTYDVPGTNLLIQTYSGVNSSLLDLIVYGFVPYNSSRRGLMDLCDIDCD